MITDKFQCFTKTYCAAFADDGWLGCLVGDEFPPLEFDFKATSAETPKVRMRVGRLMELMI